MGAGFERFIYQTPPSNPIPPTPSKPGSTTHINKTIPDPEDEFVPPDPEIGVSVGRRVTGTVASGGIVARGGSVGGLVVGGRVSPSTVGVGAVSKTGASPNQSLP